MWGIQWESRCGRPSIRRFAHDCRRNRHGDRKLAHHYISQTNATTGHPLGQLLIEHRGVHASLFAVEHALLRRRVAHAFHQHVHEHRFELLRRLLQRLGRSVFGIEPELVEPLGIKREFGSEVGAADHQMTSSSARNAPDAFKA